MIGFSTSVFSQISNKDTLFFNTKDEGEMVSIDSVKAAYERETMCFYAHTISDKKNNYRWVGIFSRKIHNQIYRSVEGGKELDLYFKKLMLGSGLGYLALTGAIVFTFASNPLIACVFLIPSFVGVHITYKAYDHLEKAKWLYNRDVLLHTLKTGLRK